MMSVLRKLLGLLSPRDRLKLYLLLGLLILMAAIETAGIASIMPFMAVVTRPDVIHGNEWLDWAYVTLGFESENAFLIFLGLIVLALLVTSNLLKAACSWFTLSYHNDLLYTLSRRLLAKYVARPYPFFLDRNTSEMGKNVLDEVRNVVAGLISPATQVLSSGLVAIAIMALLVAVDPTIALGIAVFLGSAYGIIYLFTNRLLSRIGRQQVKAAAEKFTAASEVLSGIKEIKILGREMTFLKRFSEPAERHAVNNVIAGLIADMPRFALEIVAFGGILLVVLYFLGADQGAEQMVPVLALYAFAGYRLMPALQQVFSGVTAVRFRLAALDVLHSDLAGPAGEVDWEDWLTEVRSVPAAPLRHKLELRDITFKYPEAPAPSLRSVHFTIEANTSIGLVGATGSGKTTMVDLILGLLIPTSGQLVADGLVLDESRMPAWQRSLGYVPQHIYISDDTVARNIALGIPDDDLDMAAVRRAAEIANLADFIETELKNGYDTEIGERGIRLSGGQRQRIGIARALYHDPALLILDEATSALDGITEEHVISAVRTLTRKKTIILIAHRLTTVRECDVIYLLEQGQIVATGTYQELMRDSRWFRAASGLSA